MKTDPPFAVIAHRGASGYLPEHTLAGVAMAHAMGADYIEQDVVLTRDNVLIVLHDLYLDAVSDVADRFAGRERNDGHYYAIDFSLEEIRTLRVHERQKPGGEPGFPDRFPHKDALFHIPTLEEEIKLIQGLNRSRKKNTGIYIEPKAPAWHLQEGRDIMAEVLTVLGKFGYRSRRDKAILQSFDFELLRNCRNELKTDLKLVQLIGENSWQESTAEFNYLRTEAGLQSVAEFADGIGPWLMQLVDVEKDGNVEITALASLAHSAGLFVHGYTLRADQLPVAAGGMRHALDLLVNEVRLDGVFTDHPDQVLRWLHE
ncbi:MAG: glycerophosphodiester phosphodiesterase [Xanthomonadales bacterium]|nr:glycerophosphodiester phosphodiesterase [Gammaproteobacteria bacterium]NNK51504.1 glycerophosphodiester phosphodiesterase [Xanthomonadales bacterium]